MTLSTILTALRSHRFSLTDEKRTQAEISQVLAAAGIEHEREVRLAPKEIIDLLCAGGVGIEVKIKGQKREIYRQCERYCGHDAVEVLILATGKAMGMPSEVCGKPVHLVNLSRAWL